MCSGRGRSSCSINDTHRVTVKRHERTSYDVEIVVYIDMPCLNNNLPVGCNIITYVRLINHQLYYKMIITNKLAYLCQVQKQKEPNHV